MVAIGGRVIRRRVLVSLLRVSRAPAGLDRDGDLQGPELPVQARPAKGPARSGLRIRGLERRLRSGTVIVIIVRKGNTIGKYTRLRIRSGRPARADRPLHPAWGEPAQRLPVTELRHRDFAAA